MRSIIGFLTAEDTPGLPGYLEQYQPRFQAAGWWRRSEAEPSLDCLFSNKEVGRIIEAL